MTALTTLKIEFSSTIYRRKVNALLIKTPRLLNRIKKLSCLGIPNNLIFDSFSLDSVNNIFPELFILLEKEQSKGQNDSF